MKCIARTLFATVIALTLPLVVPVHANGRKALSPQTKEKLNQLIHQRAKLDQLGANPRFLRGHGQLAALRQAATAAMASGRKASDGIISVPHFDFTATSGGQAFPLMFVGSTPKSGGRTTAITNVIIPLAITVPLLDLDLSFLGTEVTFDGSTKVANTVRSPIYRAARFAVDPRAGKTQWGDAMQRVTFFNSLKPDANDWHVLLATPIIAQTVHTSDFFDGFAIDFGDGNPLFALISGEFIDGVIASYLATHPLPPDVLPIFVSYNSFLFYGGDPFGGCCVLGYHDALATGTRGDSLVVQTFLFANWNDADLFMVPIEDIHALSHEVSEWLNDPFINNVVPPYANDQDILQWFTRETPSSALGGLYRFPGRSRRGEHASSGLSVTTCWRDRFVGPGTRFSLRMLSDLCGSWSFTDGCRNQNL